MNQAPYEGFAFIYDHLMEEENYEAWLHFFLSTLEQLNYNGKKVLDLGCGTGRVAVPLAKQGFDVTGVDLSNEMLTVAADRMATAGVSVTLIEQDIRELELNSNYDVIYSFCDSLNYIVEPEEIKGIFKNVANYLVNGGLFLFDVHSPYKIREVFGAGPIVQEDEDIAYIWVPEVEEESLSVNHYLNFFVQEEDDRYRRFTEVHQQRGYTVEELSEWLESAGFEILAITADFQVVDFEAGSQLGSQSESQLVSRKGARIEIQEDSERLFFVAKKVAENK